jgi:hypothetical protein
MRLQSLVEVFYNSLQSLPFALDQKTGSTPRSSHCEACPWAGPPCSANTALTSHQHHPIPGPTARNKTGSSPRNTARSPKTFEEIDPQSGVEDLSRFLPRAAKVDVHAFQCQIDQVRRFLGQSGV